MQRRERVKERRKQGTMTSRLNFKEVEVIALDDDDDDHVVHDEVKVLATKTTSSATKTVTVHDKSTHKAGNAKVSSSYELFDLTKEEEDHDDEENNMVTRESAVISTPSVSKSNPTATIALTTPASSSTTTGTTGAGSMTKADKKREKRKQQKERKKALAATTAATITTSTSSDPSNKANLTELLEASSEEEVEAKPAKAKAATKSVPSMPVSISSFLQKFLGSKRAHIDDFPVEDIEESKDTYLALFSQDFKGEQKSLLEEEEEVLGSELITETDKPLTSLPDPEEEAVENEEENEPVPVIETFHIYNLPYKVDAEELQQFIEKNKCTVKSVELGGDNNKSEGSTPTPSSGKKMPLGSAVVQLSLIDGETADSCIEKLQGKVCGGRQIRIQKASLAQKKRLSFGPNREINNRYFENDISVKCNDCGEVGHRSYECTNDPLPVPCHLCAGTDHDPGSCPNIICYRCSSFGHHSRDCRSGPRPKPTICFQCGSMHHDLMSCYEFLHQEKSSKYESLIEGPWVKCMNCFKSGHCMCHKIQPLPNSISSSSNHKSNRKNNSKNQPTVEIYCPNCGEEGHHVDYTPHLHDRWSRVTLCIAPKCEAFFKFPQRKFYYYTL